MIKPEQIPKEAILAAAKALAKANALTWASMNGVLQDLYIFHATATLEAGLSGWPNAKHRAHGLTAPSLVLPIEEIKPMKEDSRALQALKDILHAKEERYKNGITLETADMEQHSYENARRIVEGMEQLLPYPPPSRRRGSE